MNTFKSLYLSLSEFLSKYVWVFFLLLVVASILNDRQRGSIGPAEVSGEEESLSGSVAQPAATPLPTPTPIPVPGPAHFAQVDSQVRLVERQLKRALHEFELELQRLAKDPLQTKAMERVSTRAGKEAADELGSLVASMAKDKVKRENRTQRKLEGLIRKEVNPWVAGYGAEVDHRLRKLHREQEALLSDLAYQLAVVSPKKKTAFQLYALPELHQPQLEPVLRELGMDAAFTGGFLVMDMVQLMRSQTVKILVQKVRGILIRQFGGNIAKIAAGGVATCADGPLPFGDIVLVGMLGWTAYDIYDGVDDFRQGVENSTRSALQTTRTKMHQASISKARERTEGSTRIASELADNAKSHLRNLQQHPRAQSVKPTP